MQLAASADQALDHPVAQAIVRHAREHDIQLRSYDERDYQVGQGVVATIDGHRGRQLMNQSGMAPWTTSTAAAAARGPRQLFIRTAGD